MAEELNSRRQHCDTSPNDRTRSMGSHRVAAGTRPGLGVIYRVAGAHMPLARM